MGSTKGSSVVEFGIITIPLLALIFLCIEMDRMFLVYNAVDLAAAAGVRIAAVHGWYAQGNCSYDVTPDVKQYAGIGMLDSSKVTAQVTYSKDGNGNAICNIGSPVTVSASYPYDPLTGFFPFSVQISTTAKGTISY